MPLHSSDLCLSYFLYSEDLGLYTHYFRTYCCGNGSCSGFENSLYSWVSKFININLYTFVAYTIINIGQQLIASGYTMEIDRYNTLLIDGTVTNLDALMVYINNSGMIYNQLFTCVAYIVTGIGVLMTPTIADTIVTAGGAGVMTKMKNAAGKMASTVKRQY